MAPRKQVIHRKQKSHEAPLRRSTGKPSKQREERALAKSPVIDLHVPKALREILLNSRAQIKNHDKARPLSLFNSFFLLTRIPTGLKVTKGIQVFAPRNR
jgi:hypothetical protein